MKYPTDSAIQNHYLNSILPHSIYPQPKPLPKNRQFYQPQKFIWNNPHRTSEQMYKFYHAFNDKYHEQKQPLLKKQEQQERQSAEMSRIQHLIAFRNQTRQKFFSTQHRREQLETRLRKGSLNSWRGVATDQHIFATEGQFESHSPIKGKFIDGLAQKRKLTDSIALLKQSYASGLKSYDQKSNEIVQLISSQKEQFHHKIRSQFMLRKKANISTNSKALHTIKKQSSSSRQF